MRTATIADRDGTVSGELTSGQKYKVNYVRDDSEQLGEILRSAETPPQVQVDHQKDPVWWAILQTFLPVILLIGAFIFVMNSMQGGGSRVMQFGKVKAKQVSKEQTKVTFADVAGADEAVEELQEIKEFLEAPAKFLAIGAKIPKGVLLYGPPGTGKTLLARAVAGEAGVPFFSISGSDFVEMFVGVGASRVRDLFEQAKASAPAIVFVDEIDAVGRHRGAGMGGGHDEREQTLNQLLVEMDGFDTKAGVILIAATNRPDILDPALLRPGRFDRQIVVDRPDLAGRRAILNVHGKGKPLAKGVDVEVLARRTPGFTGADLANLMNEAALLTARRGFKEIGMPQLEEAIDRVMAGPERKSRIISEKEKRVIAYHEGGHALVGHVLPDADPIHKISIIARGRALGWTLALPTEDKYLTTRSALRDQLAMLLGGRTAEELIFQDPTTGAQNDIERATAIARAMVTEYGMSDEIGPQQLGAKSAEVFLGPGVRPPDQLLPGGGGPHRLRGPPPHRRGPRGGDGGAGHPPQGPRPAGRRPHGEGDPRHGRGHGDPGRRARAAPAVHRRLRPPGQRPAHQPYELSSPGERDRDGIDRARIEKAVREILEAIGEDPDREGLRRTPERVAAMYEEIFAGLRESPSGAPGRHLRRRPRRDDHGQGHPDLQHVRAPPGPVHRQGPRGLHPERRGPDHRAVQAGAAGGGLRPTAPGAGAAHQPDRGRAGGQPPAPGGAGRDRGRAPVHVDAGRAEAGHHHGHVGRTGPVPGESGHPSRSFAVHPRFTLTSAPVLSPSCPVPW